jgi:hypothetical protein
MTAGILAVLAEAGQRKSPIVHHESGRFVDDAMLCVVSFGEEAE